MYGILSIKLLIHPKAIGKDCIVLSVNRYAFPFFSLGVRSTDDGVGGVKKRIADYHIFIWHPKNESLQATKYR